MEFSTSSCLFQILFSKHPFFTWVSFHKRNIFFFFPTQNALLLDRVVIWLLEVLKHKEDLNTTVFYIKGVADVSEVMETSDLKDS